MSDKFILSKDQFDNAENWKYIYSNLKWLKGCVSKDTDRPVLQGIYKKDGKLYATNGFMIAAWKPADANADMLSLLMPDGLWLLTTLNTTIVVAEQLDGNYPDVEAILRSDDRASVEEGGKLTIDLSINPTLLARLTNGFDYMHMEIGKSLQMVYLLQDNCAQDYKNTENYGVIMGLHNVRSSGSKSLVIEVEYDDLEGEE